jgi:membrane protease YdiL (CAAX protease family)
LLVRLVWTLPIAIVFTWVTLRAGGSLLPPLVLHTTLNSFSDFAIRDPERLQASIAVLFLMSLVTAVLVATMDTRMTRARRRPDA